jgi:putative glutamine amidotransferase
MSAVELAQVLPNLDGMLMIGGADYPPSSYGQETEAKTSIMAQARSQFDLLVVRSVLAQPPMPYLGICAGSQVLNIGSGGELIQDIPTAKPESKVAHSGKNGWQGNAAGSHVVSINPGSKLATVYSGTLAFAVPTSHHQCVSKLGKDLQVAATTDDGVIEAIELPGDRFVVGVQWHPERDFENNSVLFAELIKQARAYRALKAKAALKSVVVGN